jgi:hypothetical protein
MHLKLFVVEYEILNRDRIESWGSKAAVRKLRFEALLCLYCTVLYCTSVPVLSSVLLFIKYVGACAFLCTVSYLCTSLPVLYDVLVLFLSSFFFLLLRTLVPVLSDVLY